jgi:regulator of replication initiation timing
VEQWYFQQQLIEFELRLRFLQDEVHRLRTGNAALHAENAAQREENSALRHRVQELESLLQDYADKKAAKKPDFSKNYSVDRNTPEKKKKKRKRKNSTGRVPNAAKLEKSHTTIEILPEGISKEQCTVTREQYVWHLIDGKATYIRYILHAENVQSFPSIPGVRNSRSEYGLEIIIALAYLVYWIGISIDKACEVFEFFTGLQLSKGQADSLLNQLASDWEIEYKQIAALIAKAAILYIDETAWKIGKVPNYTWIFSTLTETLYKCGVGRGKDILTEILGEVFGGIGVSDDYAAYDSIFSKHQLCWAHPLRKAIELSLRNPDNKEYRAFVDALFELYYEAVRLSKDKRLSVGREAKAKELELRLRELCVRYDEKVITKARVAKAKKRDPHSTLVPTADAEAKMINLHKQLYEKASKMFVFVCHPEVEPTNNRSERAARPEAMARKATRTSKSPKGAKRRGVIMSVFSSLAKRLKQFSLNNIIERVAESIKSGITLFATVPEMK